MDISRQNEVIQKTALYSLNRSLMIGLTKELISSMLVYLEENDFAKARSIFAARNMERLEDTKKKIENFRKINAYLTDSDVSESKINELSAIEKDKIYRMVWAEHVTDDILSHAEDIGVEISKEDAEILAESYVCDGEYDCNLSYWDNIENLMEDYPKK